MSDADGHFVAELEDRDTHTVYRVICIKPMTGKQVSAAVGDAQARREGMILATELPGTTRYDLPHRVIELRVLPAWEGFTTIN